MQKVLDLHYISIFHFAELFLYKQLYRGGIWSPHTSPLYLVPISLSSLHWTRKAGKIKSLDNQQMYCIIKCIIHLECREIPKFKSVFMTLESFHSVWRRCLPASTSAEHSTSTIAWSPTAVPSAASNPTTCTHSTPSTCTSTSQPHLSIQVQQELVGHS